MFILIKFTRKKCKFNFAFIFSGLDLGDSFMGLEVNEYSAIIIHNDLVHCLSCQNSVNRPNQTDHSQIGLPEFENPTETSEKLLQFGNWVAKIKTTDTIF